MDLSEIPTLDEELKQAKARPFKVRLEFDHRFDVWHKIIHRNRRLHLWAAPTPEELRSLVDRYTSLDIADGIRLKRRALKEFDLVTAGNNDIFATLGHYQIYRYRLREIKNELSYQLSFYDRIVDERIKQRTVIRLHELKQLKEVI